MNESWAYSFQLAFSEMIENAFYVDFERNKSETQNNRANWLAHTQ